MRGIRVSQVIGLVLATIVAVGCGGGGNTAAVNNPPPATQSAMAQIKFGDAPADSIVAFELTVNSVVLHSSAGDVSVLASPTRIELIHNAGNFEPLALRNIPAGAYTGATITVADPEVKVIGSTGQPVELAATLASNTANVTFSPAITVASSPLVINFDLNVAASVAISGNTATVTPTFTASSNPVAQNENEQEVEDGEVEVTGAVASAGGNSFSINVDQASQSLTFTTDSSTQFESPLTGVGSLTVEMIVEVHAVTQSDGSLLARKVEAEVEGADGLEVEGLVVSTTGSPVTQFVMVVQDETTPSSSAPAIGANVTVNLDGNTRFRLRSDKVDLSNLPFTPTFDASTLSVAQRVEVDTDTSAASTITADKVKLQEQALTGVVSGYTPNGSQASFTLTVASDSAFARLTGLTTLTVFQQPSTRLKNLSAVSNGATVRVRGLLFSNSGFKLVAERIGTP
ncbi:MAG TPA: DUF5666 domain-containing protein [Terriglobales bacterium]|nr:DUF5666 domain-containing protein [Terriglobales bacterium]